MFRLNVFRVKYYLPGPHTAPATYTDFLYCLSLTPLAILLVVSQCVNFFVYFACPACPVASENDTGVAPEDGTGVPFCLSERSVDPAIGAPWNARSIFHQGDLSGSACPVKFRMTI